MANFLSDGIEIAYQVYGKGKPIVLVHGFASNGAVNWLATSWIQTLNEAGYRCITIDNRGHGNSEKLYDRALYGARMMAGDVAGLIRYLKLGPVPVMGYSMGARIATFVALDHPETISALIIGGLGINMVRGFNNSDEIIKGLLAPSLEAVSDPVGRQFRKFAEHTKSDMNALAACMGSSREPIRADDLAKIKIPTLVAVGSEDEIGGDPEALAALFEDGEALIIADRDHMRATGDKNFKSGVIEFLAKRGA
ncbi:Hydrolase [hydrothermal vent metagenome]|uniref:Hydrolase n=1 Tax=hydrothermal vent metagenome TaxID=652676 RepID=A0A3B0TFA4_9ZZZZ